MRERDVTIGDAKLLIGDCLERMKEIPDGSVDLICADLPYQTTNLDWDTMIPFEPLWAHYKRLIKKNGAIVLTSTQPFTTLLIASNMAMFKYTWVWEKSRPGDIFNAKNKPLKAHEDVCVFSEGTTANGSMNRMPYFPQGVFETHIKKRNDLRSESGTIGNRKSRQGVYVQTQTGYPRSVIRFASEQGHHPTQKSAKMMDYLIRTYSLPGETVLDNVMGSGSTGAAAVQIGRKFIGIERDPGYYATACRRIEEAASLRSVFVGQPEAEHIQETA